MSGATRLIAAALLSLCLASAPVAAAAPRAELVGTTTSDGVPLFGLHYRPAAPSKTGVIHIPGGPGAFYSPQDMAPLAAALMAKGFHFLAFNLRTAGTNGMYYAKSADYPLDLAAIVRYAREQSVDNVILLGHSLSSTRVFYYLSQVEEPAVKAVIVSGGITSPYLESQMRWNDEEKARYEAFLGQRRAEVREGRGRALSAYPWGGPQRVFEFSASTWVDVFGNPEESNSSTVKFGRYVKLPVLVVHGRKDTTALPRNAEEIMASLTQSPDKELVWIDEGNHLFIGSAERYAEVVSGWVARKFGNQPRGG